MTEVKIPEAELDILKHSLGWPKSYRNHFCTGEGSTDYPHCMALVGKGLMTRRAGNPLTGGDDLFHVTDAGKAAIASAKQDKHD